MVLDMLQLSLRIVVGRDLFFLLCQLPLQLRDTRRVFGCFLEYGGVLALEFLDFCLFGALTQDSVLPAVFQLLVLALHLSQLSLRRVQLLHHLLKHGVQLRVRIVRAL
jgi:hypothetical protein